MPSIAATEEINAVKMPVDSNNQANDDESIDDNNHRDNRNHDHHNVVVDRPLEENVPLVVPADDNDNLVREHSVVISDNERKSSRDQAEGASTITMPNNQPVSNHSTEEQVDPIAINSNASAPVFPHHTSMERPSYHHFYDNTSSNTQDGGEMYYPYPPVHDTPPSQPWMMAPPPLPPPLLPNPYYPHHHHQQQQIDHAVAYANAAAHVAWAAAQAVQQAVMHQQSNHNNHNMIPQQYPLPPPPPHLMMGVPPLLSPTPIPPPWMGHNNVPALSSPMSYTSPPGTAMSHYYHVNGVSPHHRRPDPSAAATATSNQMVGTEMAPYLDQHEYDRSRRHHQGNHPLDDESATARSLPDTVEPSMPYHQDDAIHDNGSNTGRLGWYPRKRPTEPNRNQQQQQQYMSPPPTRDKIRRRLRSSDNESSSSGGYYHHSKQNWNDGVMKGSHQSKSNHRNGAGRGHGSQSMNKKARSTNNEALIGKTGVAALFEWCSKRHCTPTFTIQKLVQSPPGAVLDDEFECIVFLEQPISTTPTHDQRSTDVVEKSVNVDDSNCEDGFLHEWGRGYGRNKNAAKQDSARRAMQALIPGVQFDEETGILIALPSSSSTTTTTIAASFLDDLAPHLAKRLEISCDDPLERSDAVQSSGNTFGAMVKHKPVAQQKRALGTYPETSTTSEDEDRSNYYASRGASVCSVLLHTIIQIDKKRIPDMPTFSYELSTTASTGNTCPTKEGNSSAISPTIECKRTTKQAVARCSSDSFKCTAKLRILSSSRGNDKGEEKINGEGSTKQPGNAEEDVIEAVGMGGTKRDARHVASAKLLSLLFPECNNDMAKVKAAAELMRDQYAASRVHKHHNHMSTRSRRFDEGKKIEREVETTIDQANSTFNARPNFWFALSKPDDPPLPRCMSDFFGDICTSPVSIESFSGDANVCEMLDSATNSCAPKQKCDYIENLSAASVFRQLGRQKQMDYLVDSALQRFNELDDEGRLICGGGSEDDVGRTILRRAEPSDLARIRKLMQTKRHEQQVYENNSRDSFSKRISGEVYRGRTKHQVSELSSTLADVTINGEIGNQSNTRHQIKKPADASMSQLWSSTSSTVLLLCRAISAFEDPPLGCAFVSFEFSMEKGKVLRVIEIGSESHLPQERFLDCLQSFATCMHCTFERLRYSIEVESRDRYTKNDLMSIVTSFTKRRRVVDSSKVDQPHVADNVEIGTGGKRFQALRPVQEETEGSDDDDSKSSGSQMAELSQATNKPPGSVKPSKRSRFQ